MILNKIGICGCGFVGNAIYQFFNTKYKTLVYDKYKNITTNTNIFDILLQTNLLFICLPTNIDSQLSTYDMTEIDSTLLELDSKKYSGLIIIKSTITPDYCSKVINLYPKLKIIHNPEFLSAKTAIEDFSNQKHIIIGCHKDTMEDLNLKELLNIYKTHFTDAQLSLTTPEESTLVKLGCNSFYAMKIQFFTELYLICNKINANYDNVKNMMVKNGWINNMHTLVPGTDGQISYGGHCLPKDIIALSNFMKLNKSSNLVLDAVIKENKKTRKIKKLI